MKINASDVAALIGQNQYRTRDEAMEQLAANNGFIDLCGNDQEIMDDLVSNAKSQIEDVCRSTSTAELEEKIHTYEQTIVKTAVEDVVRVSRGEKPILQKQCLPESIVREIQKNADKPVDQIVEKVNVQVKEVPEIAEACKSINKIRGTILETQSTDRLQTNLGKKVEDRNARYYVYHIPNIPFDARIVGKLDGTTKLSNGEAITEIKTRRRKWATVPKYDLIQLRCYMKLTGIKNGILHEEFPDNTSRTTRIEWSETEWKSIESALIQTLAEVLETYVG
jgi:hypothetical protein